MSEVTITFVDINGEEQVIKDAEVGETMMQVATANNVEGILGDCGGGCACGTCHVYVDPEWQSVVGEPDDVEDMTLEMVFDARKPNSRLCCQITVSEQLDGLKVTVAPESL
ncbi:MAG: 2Fe-2S iron-sulfur cluster-binding protein [Pseudomonadota bacterium]|nr:2Fe-2S iron-sulfur cluster-binding protein [Pseudomonadota bacterium]